MVFLRNGGKVENIWYYGLNKFASLQEHGEKLGRIVFCWLATNL